MSIFRWGAFVVGINLCLSALAQTNSSTKFHPEHSKISSFVGELLKKSQNPHTCIELENHIRNLLNKSASTPLDFDESEANSGSCFNIHLYPQLTFLQTNGELNKDTQKLLGEIFENIGSKKKFSTPPKIVSRIFDKIRFSPLLHGSLSRIATTAELKIVQDDVCGPNGAVSIGHKGIRCLSVAEQEHLAFFEKFGVQQFCESLFSIGPHTYTTYGTIVFPLSNAKKYNAEQIAFALGHEIGHRILVFHSDYEALSHEEIEITSDWIGLLLARSIGYEVSKKDAIQVVFPTMPSSVPPRLSWLQNCLN